MQQPDGSSQEVSQGLILRENAIRCLLPSCPKYLSTPFTKPERLNRGKIECKFFLQAFIRILRTYFKCTISSPLEFI